MSNPLHHKLKSGRVLFLKVPLTDDELAECQTDAGNAVLEQLADMLEKKCKTVISSESPEGIALLKQHDIEP